MNSMPSNKKIYLAGILSVIIFLTADLVGGLASPNYNFIKNAISEQIQSGAELRFFISPFLFIHALLMIVFAYWIVKNHPAKQYRMIYIGGIALLMVGISNALSSLIFPQDPIGVVLTFPGKMHLILVGITVLLTFILIPLIGLGFYKYKNWRGFRLLTFICYPIIIIAGFASPIAISNNLEILGLTERVVSYTFYVWIAVLTIRLLKNN